MNVRSKERNAGVQYAMHYARGYMRGLQERVLERIDIRLGIELWALELADPADVRRPWKPTRAARVLGWVRFVAQHRQAPKHEGCECERPAFQEERPRDW